MNAEGNRWCILVTMGHAKSETWKSWPGPLSSDGQRDMLERQIVLRDNRTSLDVG